MAEYAKKYNMVMIVPVYEKEQAGFLYNTAAVIDADGTYLGNTGKIISRIHPVFGRSFSSNLGILVILFFKPNMPKWVCTSVTTATFRMAHGFLV